MLTFGRVNGQEFAADHFRRRDFAYYQIPLVHLQVSPVHYSTAKSDLTGHLKSNKLLGSPNKIPERWDLVELHVAGQLVRRGDAAILTQYLDTVDSDENLVWLGWAKNHPKLAQELWPVVARLARENLYPMVPDVLRAAQHEQDPTRLKTVLQAYLAEQLIVFADVESRQGQHDTAVEYYSMALDYQPGNPIALRKRADSLDALGKQSDAEVDRQAADEIDG